MPRKKTKEEFLTQVRAVHGDKYDYSKVDYIGSDAKICVICPTHGEFWPTANNHLRGSGCPQCAGRTVTKDDLTCVVNNVQCTKCNRKTASHYFYFVLLLIYS